jgi:Xaa-Pro aminopeptidase
MLVALREVFQQQKIEALFVSHPSNVFALTGVRTSNGYALVTKSAAYFFTDPRYLEKAEAVLDEDWDLRDLAGGFLDQVQTLVAKHRIKKLGIEAGHMTVAMKKRLDSLAGVDLVDTVEVVEHLRMIKHVEALRCLRQSQKLNEVVLQMVVERIRAGMSEIDVSWMIRCLCHDVGASDVSFPPIVAFGAHTARPHHEASEKKLKRGDMVLIDMGVVYKNYASDLTRSFFTKGPTSEQGDVYTTVLMAHQAAARMIKSGAKADDVDRAARLFISDSGYKKKFGHATGHGIGLDVHELPRVAKGDQTVLAPGMVITVEPGIYLPGRLGVRIEDMIEVTASGSKVLNHFSKELVTARIKL